MATGSKKAVVSALIVNSILTVLKFFAALLTLSASMMNEAVHSFMDALNQLFLYFGLVQGSKRADARYAFGHGQKKYLWNLWSAIGLFSIGAGLGIAHAWHAYHNLGETEPTATVNLLGVSIGTLWIALCVLLISLLLDGWVLTVAGREFKKRMREEGETRPLKYLLEANDPTLVAILLEDSVAVLGVLFAALGIGLSSWTGNRVWDIGFSLVIAVMLGLVAFFLGMINMRYLTVIRDLEAEEAFRQIAAQHDEVERFHDLRSVIVDESNTVVVAEIEIREESMIFGLRERIEQQEQLLLDAVPESRRDDEQVRRYVATRAIVQCTLARAEQIVDEIEIKLRERCPQISHVTIEVEGIAAPGDGLPDGIVHNNP